MDVARNLREVKHTVAVYLCSVQTIILTKTNFFMHVVYPTT